MKKTREKEVKNRKNNMKLYPFYEMIGYDLLFYYGIRVMFLSQAKLFSNPQIMFSSTLSALFLILLQLPVTLTVSKIGKRSGTILGNIVMVAWSIVIMLINNFTGLIIAQLLYSIGYALKYISEANLLSESIPESKVQNDIFTNIDKRGYSRYCFFSAISNVAAGYLFNVNKYLPLIFCLGCLLITTLLSFNFVDIEKRRQKRNNESQEIKKFFKELKQGYKFVINSKRLRALLIFTGVIWGAISILDTFQLILLQYLNVSSGYIGLVIAGMVIIKGIFSRRALNYNEIFKNRSLMNILATFALSFILMGIVAIININLNLKLIIIIINLLILSALNAIYLILAKRYFNNFTNTKILPSIYSVKSISDNLFKIISTLFATVILGWLNVEMALIITGFILLIATLVINNFTKEKLGLNPDEYTQKDIYIRK